MKSTILMMNRFRAATFLAAFLAAGWTAAQAADWEAVPFNQTDLRFDEGGEAAFDLKLDLAGPKNSQAVLKSTVRVEGETRVWAGSVDFMSGPRGARKAIAEADLDYRVTTAGDRRVGIDVALESAEKSVGATMRLLPRRVLAGEAKAVDSAGKTTTFPMPTFQQEDVIDEAVLNQVAGGAQLDNRTKTIERVDIVRVELPTAGGQPVVLSWDRPVRLVAEAHELKFDIGTGAKLEVETPGALRFEPSNRVVDTSSWFELKVENDPAASSVIGMESWMHFPAGKHGHLVEKGDHFEFADGTPAVFWGAGIVNPLADRGKELSLKRARLMRKYGMNVTRIGAFLKPVDGGWCHYGKIEGAKNAVTFDPKELALLDQDFATLKEHGVYTCLTPFYGLWPSDNDEQRFVNYSEAKTLLRKDGFFKGSFYGHMSLVPEAREIMAERFVAFLNHVNPNTGLRYAEDPAVIRIEIQNEDSGFLTLHKLDAALKNAPTYRKMINERFSDWLKEKYSNQEALAKAWGKELKKNEILEKGNVSPFPGWFDKATPRIADQLAFHTDLQREFYGNIVKAIRSTGYQGTIVGSNWHGMAWPAHLANLLTDTEIGHIDRHSYAEPSMTQPGHGMLAKGFTQVDGLAFGMSEWAGRGHRTGQNSLDEAIFGVYGMGLQGWDLSLHNALRHGDIRTSLSHNVNDTVNCFSAIVQYPALARMVFRGDVKEGDVLVNRRVSIPRLLKTGEVGFEEPYSPFRTTAGVDYAAPKAALAAGRVVMEFVDGPVDQPVIDKSGEFIDTANGVVRSNTGQLQWFWKPKAYFTVDTPGTKGVVGYSSGSHELGDVVIDSKLPYGHVFVSALDKDAATATAPRLLVTAFGRTVNKGTVFDELSDRPLKSPPPDDGPVLIEPVKATILLKGRNTAKVCALDHEGRKPDNAMEIPTQTPPDGLSISIDGSVSKTVYYLIEF